MAVAIDDFPRTNVFKAWSGRAVQGRQQKSTENLLRLHPLNNPFIGKYGMGDLGKYQTFWFPLKYSPSCLQKNILPPLQDFPKIFPHPELREGTHYDATKTIFTNQVCSTLTKLLVKFQCGPLNISREKTHKSCLIMLKIPLNIICWKRIFLIFKQLYIEYNIQIGIHRVHPVQISSRSDYCITTDIM